MTDDVSERLSEIRERVEAATKAWEALKQAERHDWAAHVEYAEDRLEEARSDVPYLLSLVEEVGEALASLSATEIDGLLGAVEYQNPENADRLVKALAQVRDAALKREYDAALRDAAQEGAE